jgi:hypothetical protein
MKNRYGADGMTFNVKVDTSTGHIDILGELDEDDEEQSQNVKSTPSKPVTNLDQFDRDYLAKQFFALNKQ